MQSSDLLSGFLVSNAEHRKKRQGGGGRRDAQESWKEMVPNLSLEDPGGCSSCSLPDIASIASAEVCVEAVVYAGL